MGAVGVVLTQEQEDFLKKNWQKMKVEDLCKRFDITYHTLHKNVVRLKLPKKKHKGSMTQEMKEFCQKLKEEGHTIPYIQQKCKEKFGSCCKTSYLYHIFPSGRTRAARNSSSVLTMDKFQHLMNYNMYLAKMKQELKIGCLIETTVKEVDEETNKAHNVQVWFEVIGIYPNHIAVKDGCNRCSLKYEEIDSYRINGQERKWNRK